MVKTTKQMIQWARDFGRKYTDRNPQTPQEMNSLYRERYGFSRIDMNKAFIGALDRDIRILEVGSNVGVQLMILQEMGFQNLYGIELQEYAVELSKKLTRNINIIQGNVFNIPFKDDYLDLVFTSGVLIHIDPRNISMAIQEIYRCTRKYIWGFEYYAENLMEVKYWNKVGLLWKCNFAKLYQEQFPNLKLLKTKKYKYIENNNTDLMYLLEKSSS